MGRARIRRQSRRTLLAHARVTGFRARPDAQSLQYVKICSLYGAGFYYIPGTDMCLKIGGWVRFEAANPVGGNISLGAFNGGYNNRATQNSTWRARGYITADARNQTEYGTVRSYIAVGVNTNSVGLDNTANQFSANRAFIQWAGFTFGLAQSFFDFYSVPAISFNGDYPASDTGDPGWEVAAYTAQFGNGLSATISAEQRRTTQLVDVLNATTLNGGVIGIGSYGNSGVGGTQAGAYGGFNVPDIVGNLRVDQAWGSAQVMGALHEVNGSYYGTSATSGIVSTGGPDTTWGFAVGAGLKLNAPSIGRGDYFQSQVNFAEGASRYVIFTPAFNYGYVNGGSGAYGLLTDGVYGGSGATGSEISLTTSWGVNAGYEHFWNSSWKTSLYGGYAQINYGSQANAILCTAEGAGNTGTGTAALANAGCNNNWSTYWIGSRTQWNVTSDFYLGLDVMYQNLQSAQTGNGLVPTTVILPATAGTVSVADEGVWSFHFRAHKDFYP
jgi:hypothetical protein